MLLQSLKNRNLIEEAQAMGSGAKTTQGAIRYLLNPKNRPSCYRRPFYQPPKYDDADYNTRRPSYPAVYERSVAERKSDPEAKAARAGYRRSQYLAKLRRWEQKALIVKRSGFFENITDAAETESERDGELAMVSRLRTIVTGKFKPAKTFKMPDHVALVPVDGDTADAVGFKPIRRGKNWQVLPTFEFSYRYSAPGETEWKNGMPKAYTRAENITYVRSFVIMRSLSVISGICHETEYRVELPVRYGWSKDENGLKAIILSSPKDDYHPDAEELMRDNAAEYIIRRLANNRKRRLETAAREAAEKAEIEGVWVGIADSRRAGNCDVGTRNFAKRHNLSVAKRYPAPMLIDIKNGDAGRVRLAITAAIMRHREEMKTGYCAL